MIENLESQIQNSTKTFFTNKGKTVIVEQTPDKGIHPMTAHPFPASLAASATARAKKIFCDDGNAVQQAAFNTGVIFKKDELLNWINSVDKAEEIHIRFAVYNDEDATAIDNSSEEIELADITKNRLTAILLACENHKISTINEGAYNLGGLEPNPNH